MRFHVISAVFGRNVASYFSGLLGYLFIIVFVVAGAFLAFSEQFFTENLCNLDQLSMHFPLLLLLFIPAITMTTWAEEKKLGTDELLFTLPATDFEILLGKYLAVLAVYTVALAFSLSHAVVLAYLGQPDASLLVSTYFGYWLAGAALLSAGMFASSLTSNTTVAFVLGTVICAVPVFIEEVPGVFRGLLPDFFLSRMPEFDAWLVDLGQQGELFSVGGRLSDFTRGNIAMGSLFYFVGLTAFFLYLNSVMIARRHWAGGEDSVSLSSQYAVRTVCLGLAILCWSYVFQTSGFQIDASSEKLHSLTSTTRDLLKNVPEDKPVTIQAFVSKRAPGEYTRVRKELIDRLEAFDRVGGANVDVRIVEVEPFSPAAEQANALGITARQVQSDDNGRFSIEDIYSGVVISSGFDSVTIPSFSPGTPIEYELTRSLGTVSSEKRKKVGVLSTDVKAMGGFDMQRFTQNPPWQLITELRKQYDVVEVSPDGAIEDEIDVLIAILPSSLTAQQNENFLDYVGSGKPVLIFDDPAPVWPGLQMAPLQPKPNPQQGGMMGMGQPPSEPKADGGRATSLTSLLSIRWDVEQSLFDLYNPHPRYAKQFPKEFVFLTDRDVSSTAAESCFNQDQEITSGLQEVLTFAPGRISSREGGGVEFTPLLISRKASSGINKWEDIASPGFFGQMQYDFEGAPHEADDKSHVIAALLKGEDKPADGDKPEQKGVNVIFVADTDIVHDVMFNVWRERIADLYLDNVLFVLNCVDYLSGDDRYIDVRKRRAQHRSLTRIEKQTSKFRLAASQEEATAEKEAETAVEEAKKRLEAKIKEMEEELKKGSVDISTLQMRLNNATEAENRKLAQQEKEVERKKEEQIRTAKANSEQEIRAIEAGAWKMAVLVSPLPAIILGLIVLLWKLLSERQGIASDRMR
ncbi:MAG: Gldg family protein [Planctomycetaceae bacterium]